MRTEHDENHDLADTRTATSDEAPAKATLPEQAATADDDVEGHAFIRPTPRPKANPTGGKR